MALFGKENCVLCNKEVGTLGRTKLTDKDPKQYVCKDCINTKISQYVEVGYLNREKLERHLGQREKDQRVYEEYFADYRMQNVKEFLGGGNPWSTWYLGQYEIRIHGDTRNICIWDNSSGKDTSYDIIHWDEVEGACIWGEYKGKKNDETIKLPDTTFFSLEMEKEYLDKDIKNLYLTLFTNHPFLSTIEIPIIKGGGREADNEKTRMQAMELVKRFNKDFVDENNENYVSNKEMKESKKDAKKALFGAFKKGGLDENATEAVSSLLGNLAKKSKHTDLDTRIEELRESHNPNKVL